MNQSLAVLNDSLRELRSRSLFWITLAISVIAAVGLFGAISFNDQGWQIFWFDTIKSSSIRAGTDGSRDFIAFVFNSFFVKFWLTWGAIILALISTSSIMPEFLAGGAIDMTLSKPVSRLKLFSLKVFGACMFVGLQAGLSIGLAYLIIGLKIGIWLHSSLWGIPLITLQFLYIYAMAVLVAVVTRSTLASLLAAIIFWFLVFVVQFASSSFNDILAQNATMLARADKKIQTINQQAAKESRAPNIFEAGQIAALNKQAEEARSLDHSLRPWQKSIKVLEFTVPKTADISKMLANLANAPVANEFFNLVAGDNVRHVRPAQFDDEEWSSMQEAGRAGQHAARDVNIPRSLGSSIVITVLTLAIAAFIFWRRDF